MEMEVRLRYGLIVVMVLTMALLVYLGQYGTFAERDIF